MLGLVENLGLEGALHEAREIYVGVLAATILFIATNAGVIGASRITYSMATYRQLPEVFRRLHPRFKTPWLALVLFAGLAPIAILLPGDVTSSARCTRSARRSRSRSRTRRSFGCGCSRRRRRSGSAGRGQAGASAAIDWPIFAIVGGIATAVSFVVVLVQNDAVRWAGLGWIAGGLIGYTLYRRCSVRESPRRRSAPPAYGPALALEYRRLLVPVLPGQASEDALDIAASLAAERGAHIAAVTVLEIPLDAPLAVELPAEEEQANRELDEARAIGETYGVTVIPRLLRGRSAGAAIVQEAARRGAEIIVIGAPRKELSRASAPCSGTPSTTCSRTRPAVCWWPLNREAHEALPEHRRPARADVRRHRHRPARGHRGERRRRARLSPRRPLPRARRRPADAARKGGS